MTTEFNEMKWASEQNKEKEVHFAVTKKYEQTQRDERNAKWSRSNRGGG